MLRFIKKSLLWIASGTVSVILTACYGVGSMAECFSKKITVVNEKGDPIPGLQVSAHLYNSERQLTDSDGVAELAFCTSHTSTFMVVISNNEWDDSDVFNEDEFGKIKEKRVIVEANDEPETIIIENAE